MSRQQSDRLEEGIQLFNREKYWECHEAWEDVWKTMTDRPEDDSEIIVRGLIQFAAGLHGLSMGKNEGGRSNLEKARKKLARFPGVFLGIDLKQIVFSIQKSRDAPWRLLGYQIRRSSRGNHDRSG